MWIIGRSMFVFLLVLLPVAVVAQSSNYDHYVATADDGGNLTPSLTILFGILFCAFLLTGLLSLYIHHWCANTLVLSRADGTTTASRFLPISITRNSGLEKSVVESFPKVVYSADEKSRAGMECAVCLSEFGDGEILRLLPKCNHAFHPDCIGGWLVSHSTCPVCRADLTKLSLAAADGEDVGSESVQVEIVGSESTSVVHVKVIESRSGSSGGDSMRRAASFPMLSSLRCGYRNAGEGSGGDGGGGGDGGENRLPV